MFSYSGIHITQEYGAPTLRDIAIQSMRIFRFCGAGEKLWPVGMHLMLVADLLPEELKHHGLLHDGPEAVVSDVPRPFKTPQAKKLENIVQGRIYHSLGLRLPTAKQAELVHLADIRAVNVEGRFGYGPRGFEQTQPNIDYEDIEALNLFYFYEERFNPAEALDANSYWPLELENRLRIAVTRAHSQVKLVKQYTKAR